MKSKVLLIDDSITIHRVIDLSIDFDRYDIVKVFSKEDAALKLQSEQFDYILLDNKLDNIIISEYISELKQQQKHATIILLVGAFDRFDETDLEKTKADDYLVKPFDSQSLNEKLSSEVDMMPAGIVERIAEADFARDNDDYINKSAAAAPQDSGDVITKEEYLENLEEVQIDDLTDKGYVEELDQTEPASVAGTIPAPTVTPVVDEEPASVAGTIPAPTVDEEPASVAGTIPAPTVTPIIDEEPASVAGTIPAPIVTPIIDEEPASVAGTIPAPIVTPIIDEEPASVAGTIPAPIVTPIIDEEPAEEIPAVKPHISVAATDDSMLTAVNNMVSLNDLEEDEDNEDDGSHIADDLPLSSIDLDEPLVVSKSNELEEEQAAEPAAMDLMPENSETPSEDAIEMPDPIKAVHSPILPDIDDAATISDDYLMQENLAPVDDNGGEMLQEFPDFPDIDDTSTDEMQDLLETAPAAEESVEIPNIDFGSNDEVEKPVSINMPAVEDEAPIVQDDLFASGIDKDTASEEPVNIDMSGDLFAPTEETVEEKPLFEDDGWLSDAPTVENEPVNAAEQVDEEPVFSISEESTSSDTPDLDFGLSEPGEQVNIDMPLVEESADEQLVIPDMTDDTFSVQENSEEQAEPLSFGFDEGSASESDDINLENIGASEENDAMSFFPEEDTSDAAAEESPVISLDETASESVDEPLSFEEPTIESPAMEDTAGDEQSDFSGLDNNISEEDMAAKDEEISIAQEPVMPVAPVMNTVDEAATPVKEAQEYKADTSDRFGGITVTISRDEIMRMLGNAIDKYFLEEAVKEVIAANMKDIVRNIVPAIAEKYIKEEIERLKNDE